MNAAQVISSMSCCVELKDLLTSCCEKKKTGLAVYADNSGIILFAYLCALLPLAAIYALDFITKDWKSIRDTRRSGKLHLAFSLPPLAVVVFYIHLQRLAEDYKEMATAITAAVLCILHVLRTLWGLAQLHAFKEWNIQAFRTLIRLGFSVPIYVTRAEERLLSFETESDSQSTSSVESAHQDETQRSTVSIYLTLFSDRVRQLLRLEKLIEKSTWDLMDYFEKNPTAKQIERTVDMHMVVNSSLVDNEFSGAELPCRLNFSVLRNRIPEAGLRVADFLTCKKPEECAVRWTVSFLARFGSGWLTCATQPGTVTKEGLLGRDALPEASLANRIAAFVACVVTEKVAIEMENGETNSEQVSVLSPLHVMCSDLEELWSSTLKVTDNNRLPYQLRGGSESKELRFEDHTTCIRNSVSAWHHHSLNELGGEQKEAVQNINPRQVAWFSKLMEEQDSHMLEPGISFRPRALKCFVWQLGCNSESSGWDDPDIAFNLKNHFPSMPVPTETLWHSVHDGCNILQASVQVDNWLALQSGNFPVSSDQVQHELIEAEVQQWGKVFSEQKRLELRRLQFQVASQSGNLEAGFGKIKFLGCVTELVRSSLAFWLPHHENGSDSTHCNRPDAEWSPAVNFESCTVVCSGQLNEALHQAASSSTRTGEIGEDKFQRTCLQMRVLWETQLTLSEADTEGPDSPSSMILCMLGYPSLRISEVENCAVGNAAGERDGGEVVSICIIDVEETDNGQSGRPMSLEPSNMSRKCREEKYCCLRIDIVEAPQPLHILFQWDSESKQATAQIGVNEGHTVTQFCWQSWKDGFMGRLCAQSEWRSARFPNTNEMIRKEAVVSDVTKGVSEPSEGEEGMTYWAGWPPFLSVITQFEKPGSSRWFKSPTDLDAELDCVLGTQQSDFTDAAETETEIDATSFESECECGCAGHELFLEANKLLVNGNEEKSLELFRDCITTHKHSLALERYVSTVINKEGGYEELGKLLRVMYDHLERKPAENVESNCQKFKKYDQDNIILLFEKIFGESGKDEALYWKAQSLLLISLGQGCIDDRCIQAFESHLLRTPFSLYKTDSHIGLGMCFLQRYCSTGHQADQDAAIQHFVISSKRSDFKDFVGIALLIEKGSMSTREYEIIYDRFRELAASAVEWPMFSDLKNMFKNIFLQANNTKHRISKNTRAALEIYSAVVATDQDPGHYAGEHMAVNRLALLHHKGVDGGAKDHPMAEALYNRLWKCSRLGPENVHRTNAMCNLGVLYGERNESTEHAEKSVQFFRDAIRQVEEQEKLAAEKGLTLELREKQSSSMNNMAVIMESGELVKKDIDEAKKLYIRAVEINENPIAMFNLAVLLKFGDPTNSENLKKAEDLFSALADLGEDLQSTPVLATQLEKTRRRNEAEPGIVVSVDVDEIDDCLAYVKRVDSSG